jgi:hypothetical protein
MMTALSAICAGIAALIALASTILFAVGVASIAETRADTITRRDN